VFDVHILCAVVLCGVLCWWMVTESAIYLFIVLFEHYSFLQCSLKAVFIDCCLKTIVC
jgi:hypothetical protein